MVENVFKDVFINNKFLKEEKEEIKEKEEEIIIIGDNINVMKIVKKDI